MQETKRIGLLIQPLDPMLFRGGRAFGAAGHAQSGLPLPQTVAGALRTWLMHRAGATFDSETQPPDAQLVRQKLQFRGPWLAKIGENGKPIPYVPAPANLLQNKKTKKILRLDPLEKTKLPGWDPPEPGMLPLWPRGKLTFEKTERLDNHYLAPEGLKTYLAGETPDPKQIAEARELFDFDRRVGIGIDPATQAAAAEQIYSLSLLALKEHVAFYEEIVGPAELLEKLVPDKPGERFDVRLGGEGRRALVTRVAPFDWSACEPQSRPDHPLLLLITPGLFDKNPANQGTNEERRKAWRPTSLAANGDLAAAAVSGFVPFSGWDFTHNSPKPTRFAVKPGAVYFLRQPLSPMPEQLYSSPNGNVPKDVAEGWGIVLKGAWNYV